MSERQSVSRIEKEHIGYLVKNGFWDCSVKW